MTLRCADNGLTFALACLFGFGAGADAVAQDAVPAIETAAAVERDGLLVERETGQPITGTVVARHPDGRLRQRYSLRDGRADGAWMEWHETGTVRLYAEWKAGLGDGVWVYFHPNGEISERARVSNDIWDGVAEGWHENGTKAFETTHDRGVRPAPVRRWNPEGSAVGPWVELRGEPARRSVLSEGWPINTALWDFSLSPDLETLFVATGRPDGSGRQVLIRRWRNGLWSVPEPAPFSDLGASEGTPVVSPDGRHVYFSSNRHSSAEPGNPHRDLYRASAESGWRTVERLTETPAYGEVSLSLSTTGQGVLWTDRRIDGEARMGLFEVQLADHAGLPRVTVIGSLNDLQVGDPSNENSAAIGADGRFMVFANYDVEGAGTDEDLYLSCRTTTGWGPPLSLGSSINTQGTESSPQIIDEDRTLIWRHEALGVQELRLIALPEAARSCGGS